MPGLNKSVIIRLIDSWVCINGGSSIRQTITRLPILLIVLLLLNCGEESTEPTNTSNNEIIWEQTSGPFRAELPYSIAASPNGDIFFFNVFPDRIYRSTDNGDNWHWSIVLKIL